MNIEQKMASIFEIFERLKQTQGRSNYLVMEDGLNLLKQYYDGLCKKRLFHSASQSRWENQRSTLEKLLLGCEDLVNCNYTGDKNSKGAELILSVRSDIKKYAKGEEEARHLRENDSIKELILIESLENLQNEDGKFDSVFYVASGGAEPALLYCARNGGIPTPIRFSMYSKEDTHVRLPIDMPKEYLREKVEGKRILVVEDIVISGKSVVKTMDYLAKFDPKAIYGCAVRMEDFSTRLKVRISKNHGSWYNDRIWRYK